MDPRTSSAATAFLAGHIVASGAPQALLAQLALLTTAERSAAVVLDDATGKALELWTGDAPATPPPPPPPGRPKLGVTPKEVTLLPRHWEWLARQPGGASATLRKLVEAASRDPASERREARDALYRAMSTLAGDLPGFEDAGRALFAANASAFEAAVQRWPQDLRAYLVDRSAAVVGGATGADGG